MAWPGSVSGAARARRPGPVQLLLVLMPLLLVLMPLLAVGRAAGQCGTVPRLALNDGRSMPPLGLGTFLGFDEHGQRAARGNEVEDAVAWALDAGYRLVDTAAAYHNEEQVGRGARRTGLPRDQLFIVTKLDPRDPRRVLPALRGSLRRLNVTYVDLFLIHNPISMKDDGSPDDVDYLDTWKSMEEAQSLGLARSIGVSNFNESQLERLLRHCRVPPAALQVEVNLNLAQERLVEWCRGHGVAVMAYTPFGSLFEPHEAPAPPPRVDDPALVAIARHHNKTVPQVVLRHLVQRGLVPIPKSVHRARIQENGRLFDFCLDAAEMATLAAFNKDHRTVLPSFWQDYPHYPFERLPAPGPDPFQGRTTAGPATALN